MASTATATEEDQPIALDADASVAPSCLNDPNYAIICVFLQKFGALLKIEHPNFVRLQQMLENTDEVHEELKLFLVRLLRKTRKSVQPDKLDSALVKFCYTYSLQDAWEIERFGFIKSNLNVKVRLVKEILETQFEKNPQFRTIIATQSGADLRSHPLGKDKFGTAYWSTLDEQCNIRIYQEHLDEDTWKVVATSREELVKLISCLKGNELVMPSLVGLVDEDSSSNSMPAKVDALNGPTVIKAEIKPETETETTNKSENLNIKIKLKTTNGETTVSEVKTEPMKSEPAIVQDIKPPAAAVPEADVPNTKRLSLMASKKVSTNQKGPQAKTSLDKLGKRALEVDDETEVRQNKRPSLLTAKTKESAKNNKYAAEAGEEDDSSNDEEEASDEGEDEGEEEEDEEYTDESDESEEVGEKIEDPIIYVVGEGSGKANKAGNFLETIEHCSENENFVGEAIEEDVMFFSGLGAGHDCDVGNTDPKPDEANTTETAKPAAVDPPKPPAPMFFFGQPGCLKLSPMKLSSPTKSKADDIDLAKSNFDEPQPSSKERFSSIATTSSGAKQMDANDGARSSCSVLEKTADDGDSKIKPIQNDTTDNKSTENPVVNDTQSPTNALESQSITVNAITANTDEVDRSFVTESKTKLNTENNLEKGNETISMLTPESVLYEKTEEHHEEEINSVLNTAATSDADEITSRIATDESADIALKSPATETELNEINSTISDVLPIESAIKNLNTNESRTAELDSIRSITDELSTPKPSTIETCANESTPIDESTHNKPAVLEHVEIKSPSIELAKKPSTAPPETIEEPTTIEKPTTIDSAPIVAKTDTENAKTIETTQNEPSNVLPSDNKSSESADLSQNDVKTSQSKVISSSSAELIVPKSSDIQIATDIRTQPAAITTKDELQTFNVEIKHNIIQNRTEVSMESSSKVLDTKPKLEEIEPSSGSAANDISSDTDDIIVDKSASLVESPVHRELEENIAETTMNADVIDESLTKSFEPENILSNSNVLPPLEDTRADELIELSEAPKQLVPSESPKNISRIPESETPNASVEDSTSSKISDSLPEKIERDESLSCSDEKNPCAITECKKESHSKSKSPSLEEIVNAKNVENRKTAQHPEIVESIETDENSANTENSKSLIGNKCFGVENIPVQADIPETISEFKSKRIEHDEQIIEPIQEHLPENNLVEPNAPSDEESTTAPIADAPKENSELVTGEISTPNISQIGSEAPTSSPVLADKVCENAIETGEKAQSDKSDRIIVEQKLLEISEPTVSEVASSIDQIGALDVTQQLTSISKQSETLDAIKPSKSETAASIDKVSAVDATQEQTGNLIAKKAEKSDSKIASSSSIAEPQADTINKLEGNNTKNAIEVIGKEIQDNTKIEEKVASLPSASSEIPKETSIEVNLIKTSLNHEKRKASELDALDSNESKKICEEGEINDERRSNIAHSKESISKVFVLHKSPRTAATTISKKSTFPESNYNYSAKNDLPECLVKTSTAFSESETICKPTETISTAPVIGSDVPINKETFPNEKTSPNKTIQVKTKNTFANQSICLPIELSKTKKVDSIVNVLHTKVAEQTKSKNLPNSTGNLKASDRKSSEILPKQAEVKQAEVRRALVRKSETKPAEVKAAEIKQVELKPAELKPAITKPVEAKPADVKPAEIKPVEVKRAEVKPAEVKPTVVKSAEVKPADVKPAEIKPAEAKRAEVKPTVAKPAEVKPADVKPAEIKPVEVKRAEVKPTVAKPAEVKPADVKPADVKLADVKPAEVKPVEVKRADVKPAEVKPADVKPVDVKPVEVKRAEVKTAEVKPKEVKPAEVKPTEVKPVEVKTAEVKTTEVKPVEVKPAEVQPVEDKPANVQEKSVQRNRKRRLSGEKVRLSSESDGDNVDTFADSPGFNATDDSADEDVGGKRLKMRGRVPLRNVRKVVEEKRNVRTAEVSSDDDNKPIRRETTRTSPRVAREANTTSNTASSNKQAEKTPENLDQMQPAVDKTEETKTEASPSQKSNKLDKSGTPELNEELKPPVSDKNDNAAVAPETHEEQSDVKPRRPGRPPRKTVTNQPTPPSAPSTKRVARVAEPNEPTEVIKTVNDDTKSTPKSEPRKKKRSLMGLDITDDAIIATNLGDTPVRQSRRIAQIKIKEEAERRKEEEIALKKLKEASEKKKKGGTTTEKPKSDSDYSQEEEEEENSEVELKVKKKKRKENKERPWQTDSSDLSERDDDDADDHDEVEHRLPPLKSDHEFSPESDIEDEAQVVPTKRARTARKDIEQFDDQHACQKCAKHDHPEWILLCDKCDKGYHCSCLIPVLFVIPEGDWFCPPCHQEKLIVELESTLTNYDALVKKRDAEEAQRQRILFTSINEANVLRDAKRDKRKAERSARKFDSDDESDSSSEEETRKNDSRRNRRMAKVSDSESSATNSSDDEPIYKLRKRRQTNVSYRFNEYDELINRAIKSDMDEVAGAGNLGLGKDISTIIDANKEEKRGKHMDDDDEDEEEEVKPEPKHGKHMSSSEDSDSEPIQRKTATGKGNNKRKKKLNSLDVDSTDDDDGSDDDFKTSSYSDDEVSASSGDSESSLEAYGRRRKGRYSSRRPVRQRRKRFDADFIDDNSSNGSDNIPLRKKKKKKIDSDFSDFNDDSTDEEEREELDSEDLCDDSTDDSDGDWKKKKSKKNPKTASKATTAVATKPSQPKKKVKRVEEGEKAFKGGSAKGGKAMESDDDDDDDDADEVLPKSRRTRGKKLSYLLEEELESSDDGIKPGVKRPDTPPEERAAFIQKQEEIKRMLAAKNTEGAKALAAPTISSIPTPEKGRKGQPKDSLSTIPLQVIQAAKALDVDLKKNASKLASDDSDGFDDDLPEDFDPEEMDEDEIAKMMEEEDFAQHQLKLAGEAIRNRKLKEEFGKKKDSFTKMPPELDPRIAPAPVTAAALANQAPPVLIHPPLASHPAMVAHGNLPPPNFDCKIYSDSLPPSLSMYPNLNPGSIAPTPTKTVTTPKKRGRKVKEEPPIDIEITPRVVPRAGRASPPTEAHRPPVDHPGHLSSMYLSHGPPLHPSHLSAHLQSQHMPGPPLSHGPPHTQGPPMSQTPLRHVSQSPLIPHPASVISHSSILHQRPHPPPNHPQSHLPSSRPPPAHPSQILSPPTHTTTSSILGIAHAQDPIIPTTVLAVQNTRLLDPSELGQPPENLLESPSKKRGRRKKFTPLRESLVSPPAPAASKIGIDLSSPPTTSAPPVDPPKSSILSERLAAISDNKRGLSVAPPAQLYSPPTGGQPSVITRLPRPTHGPPFPQGQPQPPQRYYQGHPLPSHSISSPHTRPPYHPPNVAVAAGHRPPPLGRVFDYMRGQPAMYGAPGYPPGPPPPMHRSLQALENAANSPQDFSGPPYHNSPYGNFYPHPSGPPPLERRPTMPNTFEQYDNISKSSPSPHDRSTPNAYHGAHHPSVVTALPAGTRHPEDDDERSTGNAGPASINTPEAHTANAAAATGSSSEFSGLVSYFSSQQDDLDS